MYRITAAIGMVVAMALTGTADSATGKRIAFIDAKLDNYHANTFLDFIRGDLKARGYDVTGCHALDEANGREWAKAKNVPYFSDLNALAKAADVLMVLAPSNPEVHLELVKSVIGFGKPVWVDKTFAPDLKTAIEIFRLADEKKIPMETASALRYTPIQSAAKEIGTDKLRHIVCWAPGRSTAEYLVHPVEMAVSILGPEARRLTAIPDTGDGLTVTVEFSRSRTAVIHLMIGTNQPYTATLATNDTVTHLGIDGGNLFRDSCAGILDFFDRKAPTFDRAQTIAIMKILDAARNAEARIRWIDL